MAMEDVLRLDFLGWYIFRGLNLLNFQGLDKRNKPYNNYPSESTFRYYNKLLVGGWISTHLKQYARQFGSFPSAGV